MNLLPPVSEMRRVFLAGSADYDGLFYAAVRTTGIFCRPSCPARKPRPENLEFFATPDAAQQAGYRACRRCRPLDANGRPPEWVARVMARVDEAPEAWLTEADLAGLGVEPARLRRWFREHHGMTFAAWCRERRLGRAFGRLRDGDELDDVILGHGYESHSGFREAFARVFGDAPARARGGDCIVTQIVESPLGPLLLGANDAGICLLEFGNHARLERQLAALKRRFACAVVPGEHAHLTQLACELDEYFAGGRRAFDVPVAARGTEFQERVWAELRRIPFGETISYEQLAVRIGQPGAQRAVGLANGANRVAIVIPCHRVVNKSGALGGYGGGLWRKRLLLQLEQTGRPIG